MDFTLTLGNVELCFTPSKSSKDNKSVPKISSSGDNNGLEKIIDVLNFSGKIKIRAKHEPNNDYQMMNRSGTGTLISKNTATSTRQLTDTIDPSKKGLGLEILRNMKPRRGSVADLRGNLIGSTRNLMKTGNNSGKQSVSKPDVIEKMTTPLHITCGSRTPKVEEMETILNSNPSVVFIPDNEAKLPIHHLSCNERLLYNVEAKDKAEAFAKRLLAVYPESIIEKDNIGRIPFMSSIIQWIDTELGRKDADVLIAPQLIPGLHPFFTAFPKNVCISPMAEWSIMMLTNVMDSHGGEIFDKIAYSVASIAFFVKTILLIECRNTRHKIMATSLFKRVIIDRRTAGLWLISMLRAGDCLYADRCIDYFNLVSTATVAHFIGRKRKPNPSDIENFQNAQNAVFNRIGQSNFFIPSLCLLSGEEKERAGKTKVIKQIVESAATDKFVYLLFCNDILMLLSLMISFRNVSFINGIMATIPQARTSYDNGDIYQSQEFDLILCIFICSYFFMRKASQAICLMSVSFKLYLETLIHSWFLQLTAITMGTVSCTLLLFGQYQGQDLVLSITMGLLWMTLIYLLERVIKPIFLFSIASREILKNLYWFWLLLFIAVFMFADMMHIYTTNTGYYCALDNSRRYLASQSRNNSLVNTFHGDVVMTTPYEEDDGETSITDLFKNYDNNHPYCSSDLKKSYGSTFIIMIGQFEQSLYNKNSFMFYVAMTFAFIVVIFLLTMLVTLIGEAYDKIKEKAEATFGRRRIDFAAEQIMLGNSILRSKFKELNFVQKIKFIYHWLILLFVFGVFLYIVVYYSFQIVDTEADTLDIFPSTTAKKIVVAVQLIGLGINQILLIDTMIQYYADEHGKIMTLRSLIVTPISLVFSATQELTKTFINVSDQDDDWTGRMINFERSTNAIVTESEKRICNMVAATEERILANEEEIKLRISGIVENVASNKKRRGGDYDDDSSESSTGSSHISFTRADLNLPLPC